jgi:hypothetical protein
VSPTKQPETPEPSAHELLHADRELTHEERQRLRTMAAAGWSTIQSLMRGRAREVYSLAKPEDFGECVFQHMNIDQRAALVFADVYQCPVCGRLLKDRKTPVASSLLLERMRLRELWLAVESAEDDEQARGEAMRRFRSALGLGDTRA